MTLDSTHHPLYCHSHPVGIHHASPTRNAGYQINILKARNGHGDDDYYDGDIGDDDDHSGEFENNHYDGDNDHNGGGDDDDYDDDDSDDIGLNEYEDAYNDVYDVMMICLC